MAKPKYQLDTLPTLPELGEDSTRLWAETFLAKGNCEEARHDLAIDHRTFSMWCNSPAGQLAIQEARTRMDSVVEGALTMVIEAATARMLDCLKNGNTVIDKFGLERQVPVTARDAAGIMATAFNTRQLLRKQPTQISDLDQKLGELAVKLRAAGAAQAPHPVRPPQVPIEGQFRPVPPAAVAVDPPEDEASPISYEDDE